MLEYCNKTNIRVNNTKHTYYSINVMYVYIYIYI